MDAALLGLIFLKHISDAFQEALAKEPHADPEDRDECTAENIFSLPKMARWTRRATIGSMCTFTDSQFNGRCVSDRISLSDTTSRFGFCQSFPAAQDLNSESRWTLS